MAKRSYTDDELRDAIKRSTNWTQTLKKIGLHQCRGTNVDSVKKVARKLEIDTSHFNSTPSKRLSLEDILIVDSPLSRSGDFKRRLYRAGLKEQKCEHCGRTEWRGKPIPLELDHINGLVTDNRLENLRILCCNCHAQTPTHSRKKTYLEKTGQGETKKIVKRQRVFSFMEE